MQVSLDSLKSQAPKVQALAKRYGAFVAVVVFLGVYVVLVQHIGFLINKEPSATEIEAAAKPIGQLKIDQDAVNTITELESQNIEIKTLFEDARNNPFTE